MSCASGLHAKPSPKKPLSAQKHLRNGESSAPALGRTSRIPWFKARFGVKIRKYGLEFGVFTSEVSGALKSKAALHTRISPP